MAKIVRRTLDEIVALNPQVDRARLDATTEEDIRRYMIEDGQDPDEELPDDYELVVPPQIVREKLGMTQEEFAKALRVPVGTLRNWEQRRVGLDPAVRSLMTIAYIMPEALQALTPQGRRTLNANHSAGAIASRGRR